MSASTSPRSPGLSGGSVGPEYTGSPAFLISINSSFFFAFGVLLGSMSFDNGIPTWITGKDG